MKPLQLLSEAIIKTLKDCSSEKRALTVESLHDALSCREDICSLLNGSSPGIIEDGQIPGAAASKKIARVSLKTQDQAQQSDFPQTFRKLIDKIKIVLASIEQIARKDNIGRSSELSRRLDACYTMESLALQSGEIADTISSIVSNAVEEIHFTNNFLTELSENLLVMEEQLFSCQSHNRETFMLQGQFCENLLSQTREMDQAVVFTTEIEDARNIISSRLSTIGKAIQEKRQEDELRLKEADSTIAELQLSVSNFSKEIDQVTQRANELEKEVLLDPLLQMHNRRSYDLKIVESIRDYHRTGQFFSLILIDVDHFKDVNDRLGHRAGDKCLQELAKLVGSCVRKTDFLARYGGEELMVILPGSLAEDARKVAEKIRARIDKTRFDYQNEVIRLTVSLGVTQIQPTDTDPEKPFLRVDKAMYNSKREGRNKVSVV